MCSVRLTPEEANLRQFCEGKKVTVDADEFDMDPEFFVSQLVDEYEYFRTMRRHCRTKVCFRLHGMPDDQYMTAPVPYTKEIGDKLRAQYGDRLEFVLNEKLTEV